MGTSIVWNGAQGIERTSREAPPPGPGEVRLAVEACGLCGTDLHIASGEYPLARPRVVLGHEFCGTVAQVGEDVENVSTGDRVVVDPNIPCRSCPHCQGGRPHLCEHPQAIGVTRDGGLSETVTVPASQLYRVPEGLPPEAAALTEPLACVLHAVDLSGVLPGERALVLGAGPIGVLAAALLVAAGSSGVLVSEPDPARRERVREFGATPISPEELDGQGDFGVVLECVGRPETMRQAVESARAGGTIVWVGVAPPQAEVSIRPYDIFRRELTIRGTYTNPFTMERSLALLASGRIDWRKVITHRLPLDRFDEAWEAHRAGDGLKVCVTPGTA